MKKKAFFLILFLASTLMGKELLILSFDTSKSVLQKRLSSFKHSLSSLGQNGGEITIKRFGDRYAIVLPVASQAQKEKIILALGSESPHLFSIVLPDNHQEPRPKPQSHSQTQNIKWNRWEWGTMIVLSLVLALIFAKGVRDMMRVRRSQRLIRHEQLEIEKELKKEM